MTINLNEIQTRILGALATEGNLDSLFFGEPATYPRPTACERLAALLGLDPVDVSCALDQLRQMTTC